MMRASIGRRLYVSFGLLVVAFAVLGGAHIVSSYRLARGVESSLERSFTMATSLFELRMIHQQTTVLLSSNGQGARTWQQDELAVLEKGFASRIAALREKGYPPARLADVQGRFTEALRLGRQLLTASAEAELQALSERFHDQTRVLEQLLDSMAKDEASTVRASFQELRLNFRRGAWIFACGVLGCIAVALLLAFGLRRSLVHPLRALTGVAREISENGDLTLRVPVRSGDEVGQLAGAFREMVERLRTIHHELRASGGTLAESVANVRRSAEQQQETVSSQAAALHQTRVTAEALRETSSLAAQRADSVLRVAERADMLGREGEASIALSVSGLADLGAQVQEIAQRIRNLGESTQQIGAITMTVKELADRSNMLALNAAIEAVRSGEHGKGFGVVAREIRSLADQSIEATVRVREILDAVGRAVAETVSITQRNAEQMQGGLEQVSATGESLRELSSLIRDNAFAVREIVAAVSQQDLGITQIFLAVSELSRMMADTEKELDSTKNASVMLDDVSRKLTDVVTRYRA
ncbi:methyl-accepting chemotaxis protein [Hyalangium sp.]|uniref:methyl-accepting chemotaxis protein n=1 Tax=Hyalangium sp. TaxID=2028555 RepID=UPI002D672C9F|nr:methyl-accepting chemotaxis protein [Hyalangium sp.]HYH95944.1 methyl-accepting chemotaxis protein [Hyalangium sp.]